MSSELKGWLCLLISAIASAGGDPKQGALFAVGALVFFVLNWREKNYE